MRLSALATTAVRRSEGAPPPTSLDFDSVTAYAAELPAYTPLTTVYPTTWAEFTAALSAAAAGTRIDCSGASWTRNGQWNLTKSGTSTNPIEIIFGPNCHWNGGTDHANGGANYCSIYMNKCAYLRIFCEPSAEGSPSIQTDPNVGTQGIEIVDCHDCIVYWHGTIGPCGGDGATVWGTPTGLPYTWKNIARTAGGYRNDIYFGDITDVGSNLTLGQATGHLDPRTGLHAVMFADSPSGMYDTRLAVRAHDLDYTDAISYGPSPSYPNDCIRGCTLILDARRLNWMRDQQQFPQGITFWGRPFEDNEIEYLYVSDCQGAGLICDTSIIDNTGLATTTVRYARADRCLLNPAYRNKLTDFGFPSDEIWPGILGEPQAGGLIYDDAQYDGGGSGGGGSSEAFGALAFGITVGRSTAGIVEGGSVPVTVRSKASTKNLVGTVQTTPVNMPPTVNAGDLLLVFIAMADQTSSGWTLPSGWTRVFPDYISTAGGGQILGCYKKIADGSEDGTTVNFTASGGAGNGWNTVAEAFALTSSAGTPVCTAVSCVDDADATDGLVGPSITPDVNNALVMTACALDQTTGATEPAFGTVTASSGNTVTKQYDLLEGGNYVILGTCTEAQTTKVATVHTYPRNSGGTAGRGGSLAAIALTSP